MPGKEWDTSLLQCLVRNWKHGCSLKKGMIVLMLRCDFRCHRTPLCIPSGDGPKRGGHEKAGSGTVGGALSDAAGDLSLRAGRVDGAMTVREELQIMADKWPSAIVSRGDVERFTGGLISAELVRKCDKDIPRYRHGRKIFYRVDDLLDLLASNTVRVMDAHELADRGNQ